MDGGGRHKVSFFNRADSGLAKNHCCPVFSFLYWGGNRNNFDNGREKGIEVRSSFRPLFGWRHLFGLVLGRKDFQLVFDLFFVKIEKGRENIIVIRRTYAKK